MVRLSLSNSAFGILVVVILGCAAPAFAQNHFPLELTNIKPVGVPPNGLDSDNRIYRAYPGLVYNIRPAVIGGAYPYTFALTNAPAGMTITPDTGEITWPNPLANATPTLTVTDSTAVQVSATWTITVSSTRFKFIDAVSGVNAANNGCSSSCGTGTFANPWRTIKDMVQNANSNDITYFKNGTYNVLDIPRNSIGGVWERVEISESRSVIWIAYPGTAPTLNFGFTGGGEVGPLIRLEGETIYVDGFETTNSHIIGFQILAASQGPTFRNMRMHQHGPGQDGTNASIIMTLQNYPSAAYGMVIQDSELYDSASVNILKIYSQNKTLIEDNTFHDTVAAMELKADVRQFTVRRNVFYNIIQDTWEPIAIGGNMHGIPGPDPSQDIHTSGGEINFNLVLDSDLAALRLNQDSQAIATYVYRNTFLSGVEVEDADAGDGPFVFRNNVIVNLHVNAVEPLSHIKYINVSVPSRIQLFDNLTGTPSDNIVDAFGLLTPAYAQYVGTRGHQLSGTSAPAKVQNLTLTPP